MKKCSQCSKPSTLHITEIQDGVVKELHLCESCAQEHLSNPNSGDASDTSQAAFAKQGESDADEDLDRLNQLECPSCGISFREFRSQGRLGCAHDYIAFAEDLMPLLENIHGETQHTGKYPKRAPDASRRQYELIKLRNELRTAVESEEYETAAKLRDQIDALEAKLESESAGE
jgi:protein arginine kinase activator